MKNVLILTAGYGEGHNTAARSVATALELLAPERVQPRVLDLFERCHGSLNKWSRTAYIDMINRTPKLWQRFYEMLDRTRLLERSLWTLRSVEMALEEWIVREQPEIVLSTYPVYNFFIERIRQRTGAKFRYVAIVTDSITINSVWYRSAGTDAFIVANEDTAAVMAAAGVPREKLLVLGFPVTPRFQDEAIERPLPSEAGGRRVLFMINHAKDQAPALTQKLLELPGVELTVTVGKDEHLRAAIEEVVKKSGRAVEIHGWTTEMPTLLMRSHVLIGKAGGATVQDTIAARTPMIVSKVVPGQEEGNAQLLMQNGCGAVVEENAAIAETIGGLFENDAAKWRAWEANIAQLSRPRAALDIAEYVLAGL